MKYFDKEKGFIYPLTRERQDNILHNYEYKAIININKLKINSYYKETPLREGMLKFLNIFNFKLHKKLSKISYQTDYYTHIYYNIYNRIINETAYYLLYNSIENHKIMRGLKK